MKQKIINELLLIEPILSIHKDKLVNSSVFNPLNTLEQPTKLLKHINKYFIRYITLYVVIIEFLNFEFIIFEFCYKTSKTHPLLHEKKLLPKPLFRTERLIKHINT